MTTYDDTDSGVLFKNDKKETDKHPDYTGKINVAGKELRLAAWLRDGRKGKFLSLKVSEPLAKSDTKARSAGPQTTYDPIDDEIPF